jgi:ubiquinone/menaquinone biosynthesis C-methylase UbiE
MYSGTIYFLAFTNQKSSLYQRLLTLKQSSEWFYNNEKIKKKCTLFLFSLNKDYIYLPSNTKPRFNKMKKEQLIEIEQQLSFPTGKNGIEIGKKMNTGNIGMTTETIAHLDIKNDCHLLEIGHGNCGHLKLIYPQAVSLSYTGVEISKTMQQESKRINENLMNIYPVDFILYDGLHLPFDNFHFDRIMTTNTIYFWQQPLLFLNEIYRVLNKDGLFVLSFAEKEFMQTLPFVRKKFNLFNQTDINKLIQQSNFDSFQVNKKEGVARSKAGDIVKRKFLVIVLRKAK